MKKRYAWRNRKLVEITGELPTVTEIPFEDVPFRYVSDIPAEHQIAYYIWTISINLTISSNIRHARLGYQIGLMCSRYLNRENPEFAERVGLTKRGDES